MPPLSARTRRALHSAVIEPLEDRLLMARLAGVDVSGNQTLTAANWVSLKSAGYTFALTKATEGFTFNDSTFTTNMTNAKNAGVLIGAYHYARYDNQKGTAGADQEASHFWGVIQPYIVADGKHLVPVLDLENATSTITPGTAGYTKTTLSQWAVEFLTDIKNDAAGIGISLTPMIYTGASFAQSWLDSSLAAFPLWMANYNNQARDTGSPVFNNSLGPWTQPDGWQFWQYTDAQAISGFGTTDADVFKGNTLDFNHYIIGGAARWTVNNRVTTNNAATKVYSTSSDTGTPTTLGSGVIGTILGGGFFSASFWQWQVHFDNGTTGWVGQDYLNTTTPSIATSPTPANNATVSTLPTNFTWTAGANASSYNVYLDGTLKATVTSASWSHTTIANGAHTWRVDSVNADLTVTGTTWNFTLNTDTTPPTITNVSSSAVNGYYKAGGVIPISVSFSEAVTVTGTPSIALNSGATVNLSSGSGLATLIFNYTVASGQNSSDLDYTSISALMLNGGAIRDGAGNNATLTLPSPGTTGSLGFNKAIVVDTIAPAASYGSQTPAVGNATMDFTVVYTDAGSGVDFTSLDSSDVTVTGPNGYSANATFISVDLASNGSPRTATYRIAAPGGVWNASDDGTYTVSQNASQVRDVAQNLAATGTIGTFVADLPFAYISGSALIVDYAPSQSSVTFSDDGSGNIVVTEASGLTFAPAGFSTITINGTSGADAVIISTVLAEPMTLIGQTGADSIEISNGGSYTFTSDAGAQSASVSILVGNGGSATFASSQHLANLVVNGAAAVMPGDSVTIATGGLNIGGELDLGDGAIALDYSGGSPIGSWNGSAYDGVMGLVATGRNGGTWDGGVGIVTTMPAAQSPSMVTTIGVAEASSALGLSGGATAAWNGTTVDATTVLIKYTYAGDANLSGTIDGDDYFAIDSNVGSSASGYGNGDFNYDGRVDADDYFLIDSNYGKAAAPLSPAAPLALAPNHVNNLFGTFAITSAYDRLMETDGGLI